LIYTLKYCYFFTIKYIIVLYEFIGIKKKDGKHRQKRRPGRNPRIPFTTQQVSVLEHEFRRSAYLGGTNDVHVLSDRLRLSESRVSIFKKIYLFEYFKLKVIKIYHR